MHRAAVIFAIGIVGIACAGPFVRFAQPAPPTVIGFYRMAFASIVLLLALAARGRGAGARSGPPEPRGLLLASLAGASFGMDIALWNDAIVRTSVANATLLVNTTPLHVGWLTAFVLREPLGRGFLLGAPLALVGAAVLLGVQFADQRALHGEFLALTAALFYTGYIFAMTRARTRIDALTAITCMTVAAAVVLGLFALALGEPFRGFPARSWAAMGAAALISQLIGVFSIVWAVRFMPPPFTSVALVAQPVVATFLAWWWLAEGVTPLQAVGGLAVLLGIGLASRDEGSRAG